MIIRIASMLLLVMAFSLPAFGGDVRVKKLYKENWINIKSANFDVLSNASNKQTLAMIDELENFNFFVSELLGYKQRGLDNRVPVILAKNRSSFKSMGMPKDIAGVFSYVEGGLIFAQANKFKSSTKGASWGRQVVLHELTHLLMANAEFEWASPPWYNEGIAEYLGTYVQKDNKIFLGDFSILENRFYDMLKQTGRGFESIDTESLFKTVQEDLKVGAARNSTEKTFVAKFYARALAVVHYLNADPKRRKQLYQYLSLIGRGYDVNETFSYVFNSTFGEFDAKVDAYIKARYVQARVFEISENGIIFPAVSTEKNDVSKEDAMGFLYTHIALLGDDFLGEGITDKMTEDIKALLPNFFKE